MPIAYIYTILTASQLDTISFFEKPAVAVVSGDGSSWYP